MLKNSGQTTRYLFTPLDKTLTNYVDVYKNEQIVNDLEFMEVTARPEEIRRFLLQPGDIILTKDSEDWKDIAVPAFVPKPLDYVICGYHLALVRPNSPDIDANYLFRSFQAAAINYQFQVEASGITRYGLGKRALGGAWILLPPLSEQRAIAAYLDRETARIDRLIEKIEESIALLQQQRTALISAAVTGKISVERRCIATSQQRLNNRENNHDPLQKQIPR